MDINSDFTLGDAKVLIFVVAYNAETTLASTLDRIPAALHQENVEVLVIDDSSQDDTFFKGLKYGRNQGQFKVRMLRTPENQGYGGNQKLGYRYAIDQGFDFVALVHGDGQYAPEKLCDLLQPLLKDEADVVFGSRMMERGQALKGGMPLYKYVGNKILSSFENVMLHADLTEFHSGYRLFSTKALKQIPFERNTNDFHFDTEIIIQLLLREQRIKELPIPTYYGDEICYVNGMRYAWDVAVAVLKVRFHQANLLYDRKYDVGPVEETYDLKLGYTSSHTLAIDSAESSERILDIGCGQGLLAMELVKKGCRVTGLDQYVPSESPEPESLDFHQLNLDAGEFPVDVSEYERIYLLDIIEHLRDPEVIMEKLRHATGTKRPEIFLTTANIGFVVTRLMLFFGQFNYGRMGILDRTHTRLFTFKSLEALFLQTGFKVLEVKGIPAPIPKAVGLNFVGRVLLKINEIFIHLSRGLFSYQIMIRAVALPTVENLLRETEETSSELAAACDVGRADNH